MKLATTITVMENRFRNGVRKDRNIHNACLLVHSDKLGLHLNMAEGSTKGIPAHPEQPFFLASAGKLFTSVLVCMLSEQGKLSLEDAVVSYVAPEVMQHLHVYQGKDYTNDIQIRHLLGHTSGLPDHFEDKPKREKPMLQMLLDNPSRFWTSQETIQWSKENLNPRFPPGTGFHYSDTGYHLLGLVIENITSRPFHEALRHYIFEPLGMKYSFLLHHSEPMEENHHPVADFFIGRTAITQYRSLSIDYAGGGIVATTEDLLKFMKALVNHEIINRETRERMNEASAYFIGIDYGLGIMIFKTVPLLMPAKYNIWGHAGMTGSLLFYHPELDAYFIGSFNQFRYHRKAIIRMFKLINILNKFHRECH